MLSSNTSCTSEDDLNQTLISDENKIREKKNQNGFDGADSTTEIPTSTNIFLRGVLFEHTF